MLLRGECYEHVYIESRTNYQSFKVLNDGAFEFEHFRNTHQAVTFGMPL
jgi:hypothetical protein